MTVPRAHQCAMCEREAVNPERNGALCERHLAALDDKAANTKESETKSPTANPDKGGDLSRSSDVEESRDTLEHHTDDSSEDSWHSLDFSATNLDIYPDALRECEQWMVQGESLPPFERDKAPYAPWEDDEPARWGLEHNRTEFDTAYEWVSRDPRADGLAFIQLELDPYVFVDGDDVRCPETGDVHPEFLSLLDHLGMSYADVSTSGSGVHVHYTGDLPGEQGQAMFAIDTEPWGSNDSPPTVEIYANKHVCITSGEHVNGTPLEIRDWDSAAVEEILDEYDALKETAPVDHDTDSDRSDLADYDPDAIDADDTAEDIRDVFAAVERLEPRDVPLRTPHTGEDSTGWRTYDPAYRASESGESLHYNGHGVFYDHKHGEEFGVLALFAAEEGIISTPWDRLDGSDWWDAVEAARDAGAPIPGYDGSDEVDHVAVLPPAVRDLSTATTGWDWKHAAHSGCDSLTVEGARERTVEAIIDAYEHGDRVLIEALPTMGKSYGAVKAAVETCEPVTILTGRGRTEQYNQLKEWCEKHGLEYLQLPSFIEDCDTANGEYGKEWAETVRDWYRRGATPKQIHKSAEYHLGEPLPCQKHDGHSCPYSSKWKFEPEHYDVLIGHYNHGYRQTVTIGRTVVFDEFPAAYETELSQIQGAVSYWLETTDDIPFESWTDLIENRDDDSRRADALLWFEKHGIEPDETHVFEDSSAHADAPLAVFTLLAGENLGNGFEVADLQALGTSTYNRSTERLHVLRPPATEYASGVVALDGTPTKRMWQEALGERLNHREILGPEERAEYIRDALNLNLVRASEHVKSYNSPDHINTTSDGALLRELVDEYDEAPGVITTKTAVDEYDSTGLLEVDLETGAVSDGPADQVKWYGDVLGSNEFKDKRLGAVMGSNHYGDDYIKRWGAYVGEAVSRQTWGEVADHEDSGLACTELESGSRKRDQPTKGSHLSYTGIGGKILTHMREHETLQAAMRFGRDGNGAVVYVLTDTLPDWVPLAGEARVVKAWSDGMRQVLEAAAEMSSFSTGDIADHPAVEVGERQTLNILQDLHKMGYLAVETEGRGYIWRDDGLHRINDDGEVELEPVEIGSLTEEEVDETIRTSTYTWDFVNCEVPADSLRTDTIDGDGSTPVRASIRGEPPPDDTG